MPSTIALASSVGQMQSASQSLHSVCYVHARELVDRRKHVHSKLVMKQIAHFGSQGRFVIENGYILLRCFHLAWPLEKV